jgi:hypothetical protein
MEFLAALWMPILVSAVAVFVVSSIVHMALPIHKGDHRTLPDEEGILEAMRKAGVGRGTYMFPGCTSMKQMAEPETVARFQRGPVGFLTVVPNGPHAIGRSLLQWFLLSCGISVLTAYVAFHALPAGAAAGAVLRIAGSVAIAGYALGAIQDSIWKGVPWRITLKFAADGVLYGLATAAVFAWTWPGAA